MLGRVVVHTVEEQLRLQVLVQGLQALLGVHGGGRGGQLVQGGGAVRAGLRQLAN